MLRSTASKIAWVGRTASMVFGLALVLALIFGLASTALSATGGNFILGKGNTATSPTSLVSTLADTVKSAFIVQNKSGGPALDLRVGNTTVPANDVAPMKVNSNKVVSNLNADQLDGKAASDFAAAYKRTVVVSPIGTDTENGTALLNALNGITDASASKPYLLHIEPGTYNLGAGTLQMQPYVDIEGSGELNTLITSSVSTVSGCTTGTVRGANNSELRFLTARNTGAGGCNVGIFNSNASPRLTHVTAEAIGPQKNIGVYNDNSSPTITQSKLSGSAYSLNQQNGGTAKVAFTQLVGPVTRSIGTLQCFNNYDANLAPVTCP